MLPQRNHMNIIIIFCASLIDSRIFKDKYRVISDKTMSDLECKHAYNCVHMDLGLGTEKL